MEKFNLVDNAKDSLDHAIEHLSKAAKLPPRECKRVIVDLSHVMELLFKEKLRAIHPAFIYENIDKFPSVDVRTVGAEKAFERLQKIAGVVFSKANIKAVKTARDTRNKIEHFEFSIDETESNVLIGQLLLFIFEFSIEQLNLDWKQSYIDNRKWHLLFEFTEFYTELLNKAETLIETEGLEVMECPSCHNETFDLEKESCLVCGHEDEVLECLNCNEQYLYSTVDNEGAGICPHCEWEEGYAAAHHEKY